jgi:peptidoglycan-associated lipoprotein
MDEKGMTKMRRGLVARAAMVAILMVGCAKTPATTTSAPAPTGSATSGTSSGTSNTGMTGANRPGATTSNPGSMGGSARVNPSDYAGVSDLADVHFDFDKYDIRSTEATLLDSHAAWLKQNGDRLILIEGHCDERGTTEYNVALGERRAKATMNYLVSRGISASRIAIVSYGEERPGCGQHTEGCWTQNRRAHFLAKRG